MKKPDSADDGSTIADMNIEGMPWYDKRKKDRPQTGGSSDEKIRLTAKEWFAVCKAAFCAVLPLIVFFGMGYFAIMLFLRFVWLR